MTKEERTDIRVGVTVLIGIALLLAGIAWAKHWHIGAPEETHRAVFPTAAGLELGDPVDVNGVKLGTVKEIQLQPEDVIVTMEFPSHVDFRSDAAASIYMLELMGGKKIEIRPGTSPEPLAATAIIPGNNWGDIGSLVAMVTSLSTVLTSITGKTDTLFTSLNGMLQGDTLKTKLNRTLDKASGALSNVDLAATRAAALLSEDGPAIGQVLHQADSALTVLSTMERENRVGLRVFIDSGGRAIADARRSLARLDSLLAGGMQHNTLLYRLTKDEGFATRVDSALESLTKLSEQLRLQGLDANIRFWNSSKPVK
ncbi:MAG: MlaD family protein [Candidatus Kapaibacterium sp.]